MAPLGSFYSSGPGPVGPTEGLIPIRSPGSVAQFATSSASESSAAAIRASTALATLDPDAANAAFAPCSLARVASAARKRRACSDASRMRESVSRALRSAGSSAKMAVARSRRTRRRGPKAEAADPLAAEAATQHCPESDGCGRGRPIQRGLVIAGWVMVRGHAEIVTEGTEHDQAQALLHSGIRNSTRCRSHLSRSSALSGRRTGAICPRGRVSEPAPSSTTR